MVESIANGDSHVPFRDSKLTMLLQVISSHIYVIASYSAVSFHISLNLISEDDCFDFAFRIHLRMISQKF